MVSFCSLKVLSCLYIIIDYVVDVMTILQPGRWGMKLLEIQVTS